MRGIIVTIRTPRAPCGSQINSISSTERYLTLRRLTKREITIETPTFENWGMFFVTLSNTERITMKIKTLLVLGLCSYAVTFILARNFNVKALGAVAMNTPLNLHVILFGILGLGIAQLIQYLYDDSLRPGFIIRHANKFICAYVIIILAVMVSRNVFTLRHLQSANVENAQILYLSLVFFLPL